MQFYSLASVPPINAQEKIFRYPILPHVVAVIIFGGLMICSLWFSLKIDSYPYWDGFPKPLLWLIAFFMMVFTLMAARMLKACASSGNWLVRVSSDRVLVKFRSVYNFHFQNRDLQAFSLSVRDISSVRVVRHKFTPTNLDREVRITNFLELKIAQENLTELEKLLAQERVTQDPRRGNYRYRSLHYPVEVLLPDLVRLDWTGIRPGIKEAVAVFSKYCSVAAETRSEFNTAQFGRLSRAEQEQRILELAQRGDQILAAELARQMLGGTLGQAKQWVDELLLAFLTKDNKGSQY